MKDSIFTFENVRIGRPPSGCTGSDMALSRAMELIGGYTSNHKLFDDSSKRLSTRVTDLGTGDMCLKARIVMGDGKMPRDDTLSHC